MLAMYVYCKNHQASNCDKREITLETNLNFCLPRIIRIYFTFISITFQTLLIYSARQIFTQQQPGFKAGDPKLI